MADIVKRLGYNGAASGGGSGTITSVNGDTGPDVVLDSDNIPEGSTNLYFTDTRAQDAVASEITDVQDDINDLVSLSGVPVNSVDLGTFSGATIPDNSTIKQAIQALETDLESIPDPFFYAGTWNALTNTPTLADGTGSTGAVYRVNVAGSQNLGSGSISFAIGDKVVYNGTIWEKWDVTDEVTSVFNRTGDITAQNGDYSSSQITNTPSGGISETNVQDALNGLDNRVTTLENNELEFPLKAPITVLTDAPSYGFAGGDDDTGITSTGDGNISFQSNGQLRMHVDQNETTIVGNLVVDTINGEVFPSVKTANTIAGFDSAGNLESVPGWEINTNTGGMQIYTSEHLTVDDEGRNIHNIAVQVEPDVNVNNNYTTLLNLDISHDRDQSGKDDTGTIQALNIQQTVEGNGLLNTARMINGYQNIGTGTSTGYVDYANLVDFYTNIYDQQTVRQISGVRLGIDIRTGATLTEDANIISHYVNGEIGRNLDIQYGYTGNELDVANNMRVINYDINGTVGNDFNGLNLNTNVDVGQTYNGFNVNNNGNIANDMNGLSIGNNGTIGQNFNGININQNGSTSENSTGFTYGSNSDFSNSSRGIDIRVDGSGPYKSLINAYSNNGTVENFSGIQIGATGTVTNSVNGLNINLDNISSPGIQKNGIQISGGSLGSQSHWDTDPSKEGNPQGVFGQNFLGGMLHIADGYPIDSGAFGFGNNLGITILAEDNMLPDATGIGLGYSVNGFVNQIAVKSGKTLDTINYMVAGGGIPPESTGGSVDKLSLFRALGFLPSGGTLEINNLYGFKVDPVIDLAGATNTWGLFVDAAADNYVQKLAINTPTKKTNVALEVNGESQFGNITQINGVTTSFPATQGASSTVLTNDGTGTLTWQIPTSTKYTATFNATTDWTLNVTEYETTITAATHGLGTDPTFQVMELDSGNYSPVGCVVLVNGSGDITIQVSGTPDNRFTGKIIIS